MTFVAAKGATQTGRFFCFRGQVSSIVTSLDNPQNIVGTTQLTHSIRAVQ